jgi:hypothetical protein
MVEISSFKLLSIGAVLLANGQINRLRAGSDEHLPQPPTNGAKVNGRRRQGGLEKRCNKGAIGGHYNKSGLFQQHYSWQ